MFRCLVVAGCALVLLCCPAGGAERTPRKTAFSLETLAAKRPRLILTDQRLAELKQLATGDALLRKGFEDVRRSAEACAALPKLVYRKRGPRLLHVSRDCLRRTYALGLAWRLTGRTAYARKAADNLLAVCAFADWNPSHFLDTAEMSHAVGVGYDWLYGVLDAESREKIRAGLIRNGLKPGVAAYGGRAAGWTRTAFNWNQVCNGGLIIGALAIADSDPQYAERIVPAALASLPRALATYEPEGAWPEGPGYWHYATRYTVWGLAALETALGTDYGLSDSKGLARAGLFPLLLAGPTGHYVNFADVGDYSRRRRIPSLFWLARRYGDERLAAAERAMIRQAGADPMDVIWYVPPGGGTAAPLPLDTLFRGPVGVAVLRSAWEDPNALFLSVKAGYNQVNHGHLDLGTFELDALGVRWARDLGSDDYNLPGYWSKGAGGRRWTYYRLGSLSHNVPLIDGANQDVQAKAKWVRFESAPQRAFATVDLTSAYQDAAEKATRGVALVAGRRAAVVQDELVLRKPCEVLWGMTTDAAVSTDGDRAVLQRSGRRLTARLLSPAGGRFESASAERDPPEKANKGVRRLICRLKRPAGAVRITVLLSPEWPDGKPAEPPEPKPLAAW